MAEVALDLTSPPPLQNIQKQKQTISAVSLREQGNCPGDPQQTFFHISLARIVTETITAN